MFDYPPLDAEIEIIQSQALINTLQPDLQNSTKYIRNLTDRGLEEGVSTRLLVYAGKINTTRRNSKYKHVMSHSHKTTHR